jgi:putative Mg2+ transporter-C (MgtC) family protein
MNWLEIIVRLSLATGAGMLIGIDRELRHKPAGLRTHMLVSLGAAAAMLVALQLDANASRVVQGVVTGIGFIGAGTILQSARHIEGVTTAASIWTCTMIGLAAGGGYYKIMVVTLALTLFILAGCVLLEHALRKTGK